MFYSLSRCCKSCISPSFKFFRLLKNLPCSLVCECVCDLCMPINQRSVVLPLMWTRHAIVGFASEMTVLNRMQWFQNNLWTFPLLGPGVLGVWPWRIFTLVSSQTCECARLIPLPQPARALGEACVRYPFLSAFTCEPNWEFRAASFTLGSHTHVVGALQPLQGRVIKSLSCYY